MPDNSINKFVPFVLFVVVIALRKLSRLFRQRRNSWKTAFIYMGIFFRWRKHLFQRRTARSGGTRTYFSFVEHKFRRVQLILQYSAWKNAISQMDVVLARQWPRIHQTSNYLIEKRAAFPEFRPSALLNLKQIADERRKRRPHSSEQESRPIDTNPPTWRGNF